MGSTPIERSKLFKNTVVNQQQESLKRNAMEPANYTPLFIATHRFDSSDRERWSDYCKWACIPNLSEVVSLDSILCPRILTEIIDEDWNHIVNENFRLDYFYHLDYLLIRVENIPRRNILGVYRNPVSHITDSQQLEQFDFIGYDVIDEKCQISALNNCGGFPEIFQSTELNQFGISSSFERAIEIKKLLIEKYPEEPHALCELYAIWRLKEA